MKKIGVIGLGSFGTFLGNVLSKDFDVMGYDEAPIDNSIIRIVDLKTVLGCDIVILAIPTSALEAILEQIKPYLLPDTLLIEVSSVKVAPRSSIKRLIPEHANILMTHPLFGPQSAARSTKGHRLIVTEQQGSAASEFLAYCSETLELDIIHCTVEEHDRTMARVHALTFFLARGLANMGLPETELDTPSYTYLLNLVKLDATHSEPLFQSITTDNPYAHETRRQFITELEKLYTELETENKT